MSFERKRGIFSEPDVAAKRLCTTSLEYRNAFAVFDRDGSGNIDISELNQALLAVKRSVESGTTHAVCFTQPFHTKTLLWLAARFAADTYGMIGFPEFSEMMQYIERLKDIFAQIDTDRTGDLSVAELSRALKLSGFNVTGFAGVSDALSMAVAERIGRAYDEDRNGVLTFDEFVQLRLEWDCYLSAWVSHVPAGMNSIHPQQLLTVLDAVKRSLEPVGNWGVHPTMSGLQGFDPYSCLNPLFYNSIFRCQRSFLLRTAELLIIKFGSGSAAINFEQFCMMMEFVKEQKSKFVAADIDRSGSIDMNKLATAFAVSGFPLPINSLLEVVRHYDQVGSGSLEFDEFLQMMAETYD